MYIDISAMVTYGMAVSFQESMLLLDLFPGLFTPTIRRGEGVHYMCIDMKSDVDTTCRVYQAKHPSIRILKTAMIFFSDKYNFSVLP